MFSELLFPFRKLTTRREENADHNPRFSIYSFHFHIFPKNDDKAIFFQLAWRVRISSVDRKKEILLDAMDGSLLHEFSLISNDSYSRSGTVDGPIYPEHCNDTRADSNFADLLVKVYRLDSGLLMDEDNTDTSGDYSLAWTSATAAHKLMSILEGPYVDDTIDANDSEIKFETSFSVPYTGTQNWTWSDSTKYAEQLNVFFHVNKAGRWFDNYTNIDFKVDITVNRNNDHFDFGQAHCEPGSVPELCFNNVYDGAKESDIIFHEYAHAVIYKMHDTFIDNSDTYTSQGNALDEGLADYFSATINNDDAHNLCFGVHRMLNGNAYPADFDSTNNVPGTQYDNGLIPGGACWDLRLNVGQTTADSIIIAALEMTPRVTDFEEFFDISLLADDDIYGNGYWNWPGCGYG